MPIIEFFAEKSGIDSMDNLVQIDGEGCFESSVSVAIEYRFVVFIRLVALVSDVNSSLCCKLIKIFVKIYFKILDENLRQTKKYRRFGYPFRLQA